jgi:alpha-beta hydrolase superfamily lysophospholipase
MPHPASEAKRSAAPPTPTSLGGLASHELHIPCGRQWLYGDLCLPPKAAALVLFAHGSGSGRHSARNRRVAQALQQVGLGTLLFDLLNVAEERDDQHTGEHRFNIALLTQRLQDTTLWAMAQPALQGLALGYFGASTGSAAALLAAARLGPRIGAVVSRGGRPDLAGPVALASVKAPTLLIVGGADTFVLELNQEAATRLQCPKRLAVVPGATHLFEEPGALDEVARLAADWFSQHLLGRTMTTLKPNES